MPFSGTVGSLVTVPLIAAINYFQIPGFVFIIFILIAIVSSLVIIKSASTFFINLDPREIIIDEVIGCMIALYALPARWHVLLLAFGLFRLLDGTKLCGLSFLEKKIPGAYGILCDDIAAGLMVNGAMRYLIVYFL